MFTAVLYLLFFHLSAAAPMRSGGNRPANQQGAENLQEKTAGDIVRASGGQNVQLHLQVPKDAWTANSFFFTTVYFRAAYEMYPRRVYVGTDDRVINYPEDLKAVDQVPTVNWLRHHGVSAVFSFVPANDRGPGEMVYRVP